MSYFVHPVQDGPYDKTRLRVLSVAYRAKPKALPKTPNR